MKAPKPTKKRRWRRRPEILLCPNIPAPMHGMAPRVVLGSKWWDETRRAAYESTNFRCMACGVHKYRAKSMQHLEGHELYDIDYFAGTMTYVETVPLCHYCHNYIHDGRLAWLLRTRQIHQGKYIAIIQHGNRVLEEAGLYRPTHAERDAELAKQVARGKVATWDAWRLVVFGRKYKGRFKSQAEWEAYVDGR